MVIFQAIEKLIPDLKRLSCWNHTIKVWLKKHCATTSEIPAYVSHLRKELLNCKDKASYERLTWETLLYSEIDPEVS